MRSSRRLASGLAATLALGVAAALGPAAPAAEPEAPRREAGTWAAVELEGGRRHDLVSAVNGRAYRVYRRVPAAPPPPGGYPAVYLLDGDAWFAMLAELARLSERRPARSGVEPCLIIGIGYPEPPEGGPAADDQARRFFDLTPPVAAEALPPRPGGGAWPPTGGAARFTDVIEREIEPLAEAGLPVDPGRRTLVGHSLAGLFVLHSLFGRPGGFAGYVAGSPSLWFDDRRILDEAETFLAGPAPDPRPRLLLTVGGLETAAGPGQPPAASPADGLAGLAAGLAERLAERPAALETRFAPLPGETHLSAVPAMLSRALRFACGSG